jgi:hypothetical protein
MTRSPEGVFPNSRGRPRGSKNDRFKGYIKPRLEKFARDDKNDFIDRSDAAVTSRGFIKRPHTLPPNFYPQPMTDTQFYDNMAFFRYQLDNREIDLVTYHIEIANQVEIHKQIEAARVEAARVEVARVEATRVEAARVRNGRTNFYTYERKNQ